MTKKKIQSPPPEGAALTAVPPGALAALSFLGATSALWALFQWMELVVVKSGGSAFCEVGELFDCAAVWQSPVAAAVHRFSGIPLAGWGVVWSLVALVLPLWALVRAAQQAPWAELATAIRLTAAAGVLASLALFGLTLTMGTLCLGCLGTYGFVAAYAGVALVGWRGLGFPGWEQGLGRAAALTLAFAAALLVPGLLTPQEGASTEAALDELRQAQASLQGEAAAPTASTEGPATPTDAASPAPAPAPAPAEAEGEGEGEGEAAEDPGEAGPTAASEGPPVDGAELDALLGRFISDLPAQISQALADTLSSFREAKAHPSPAPRDLLGPAGAPVRLTDFTDVRCPHCAQLDAALEQLRAQLPAGSFASEARHYPLDQSCNPQVPRQGDGISCYAAKARICAEGKPGAEALGHALFKGGRDLSEEKIFELGAKVLPARALDACIKSPETAQRLADDIAWASLHGIRGTPMVLINGRSAPPYTPLLVALILAQGNDQHPAFRALPEPKPHDHPH